MKYAAVASALFAAVAIAQPHGNNHVHNHNKRALVTKVEWVTEVEYVTQIVDATTTLWVTPGHDEPTTTSVAPVSSSTEAAQGQKFIESEAPKPKEEPSTSTSVYVAPAPTTLSSVYVAPKPTEKKVEPPKETYVAPKPEPTTSVYVAPPAPKVEAPKPKVEAPKVEPPKVEAPKPKVEAPKAEAPKSGGGSSAPSGEEYAGELTWYDIGMGSCGISNAGEDMDVAIVALSKDMMGPVSNGNPMCGKTITIKANGKTATALVRDKCMGCARENIDVSKKVFLELFGDLGVGRSNVEWWFNN